MPRTIMLIPADTNIGLTSVILGIMCSTKKKNIRLNVFTPIMPYLSKGHDLNMINHTFTSNNPLEISYVESLLRSEQQDLLMEKIIANYYKSTKHSEVVLIRGITPTCNNQFYIELNYKIARALSAEIVFVFSLGRDSIDKLQNRIELMSSRFGGRKNKNIKGVIINKLNAPTNNQGLASLSLFSVFEDIRKTSITDIDTTLVYKNISLPVLGCIPWNFDLSASRVIDIARYLHATIIHEGEIQTRYVKIISVCTQSLPNIVENFCSGLFLVISADCPEVLVSVCLAAMNGIEISAILLTDGHEINPHIYNLCTNAFRTGLPMFSVKFSTWQTLLLLQNFKLKVPVNDHKRLEKLKNYIATHIDDTWIESLSISPHWPHFFSPAAFRYQLTERARKINKRIVLPEGTEVRIIKAACICAERGIACCVLLGNPDEIKKEAADQGFILGRGIEIIDPEVVRNRYVNRLVYLRKNKGMTESFARKQLEDNVVLGTLMLEQGEVDGLVSGVAHTTANTIRPALQLIKTSPGNSLVSSVFFMLLPEQVLVYGDCAINVNPTPKQLAEIAIQSADSAATFDIEPRVAMISYSTGDSAVGSDVEKVREATKLARVKRPDLVIDGPLQYDAAVMADVARLKAPNSPVAGRATVFVFPDLNTGNTTYKAVQRSAELISIGPMLQGMRKPVNDLSRGALVDDIIYTIALTVIQSDRTKSTHMSLEGNSISID